MSAVYRYVGALAGLLAVSSPSTASTLSGVELARANQCLACHQVAARRVGPPFKAIAQRFGDRPDAGDYLAQVIRQGSRGQWGAIPMPAQNQVSAFDAQRLAQWILSLQPSDN